MVVAELYLVVPWYLFIPMAILCLVILWHELGFAEWLIRHRKQYGRRYLIPIRYIWMLLKNIWDGLNWFIFRGARERKSWAEIEEESRRYAKMRWDEKNTRTNGKWD